MKSLLAWMLYVAIGALYRLAEPTRRIVKLDNSFIYLTPEAVWRVGPKGKEKL